MGVGKSFKKFGKSVGEVVSKVAKIGAKLVSSVTELVGGKVLDNVLGLESLGAEVERWGDDLGEAIKVMSGEYHKDMKALDEKREYIDERVAEYNNNVNMLVDQLEGLIAFHEIFQMSASNKLDSYTGKYGAELDALIAEYKAALAQLRSEYDFVIGLTEGSFIEKLLGSVIMIFGGIMSDFGDILSGEADGDTWKRMLTNLVLVLVIVFLWWFPPVGWTAMSVAIGIALAALSAFLTMDGMYANGAATGAIMGMLDTVFNDILNLDDLIGSDFNKFDKDNEDYEQMVMYVKLAIALAQLYNGFTAGGQAATTTATGTSLTAEAQMFAEATAGPGMSLTEGAQMLEGTGYAGATKAGTTTSLMGGVLTIDKSNLMNSTFAGVKAGTYSSLYKAYSTAAGVNDVVAQNEAYEEIKNKMEEDKAKLEKAITSKISKSFMKSYKDMAYFLQDQQEYIDRYIWGMAAQNMYVDPYGTTPVANIRFTPDKDTRMMTFGYEEVFDESKQAGSRNYFNNILYG